MTSTLVEDATGNLPLTVAEVTPEWLTGALADRYPGTVVTAMEPDGQISGTATKIRYRLSYNEAGERHGLPARAWLKGGFDDHGYGHAASYIAEARFFGHWAREVPINIPKSYYEGIDREGRQGLVLLEDLDGRGARYGLSTDPVTPEIAAAVLRLQARYHARWWGGAELGGLRSYTDRFAAADYWLDRFLEPTYYAGCVATARGETAPTALHDPAIMRRAIRALWAFTPEGVHSFVHGDGHIGNYFFERDSTPGLLDWQAYIRAQPMHDVAYFLIGALTTEDRRRHERDLIAGWIEALRENGVADPIDFDTAWETYRRFAIHGFVWVATPTAMHPEPIIEAYARRYGAACADLDTLAALGFG